MEAAIRGYVESYCPIIYLSTYEEDDADRLVSSVSSGRKIIEWNMASGHVDFSTKRSLAEYANLEAALETWLDMELSAHTLVVKDAHLALRENPLAVTRLKALANNIVTRPDVNATVFLVSSQAYIPPELEKFITIFELPLPAESQLLKQIAEFAGDYAVEISDDDLASLAHAFRGLSKHEVSQLLRRAYQDGGEINRDDVQLVLAEKEQIIKKCGTLELVRVKERLDDIGGLARLKAWLRQKSQVLSRLSEARKFGVEAPKGIMIVGMPGCGKSLAAKAAAALFQLPLLRLDVGSLMGKYVGESEANMRKALKQADAISPCVLWIDELEKAFVGMGSGNTGSEVASRLFGYFLTWMQEKESSVFVLATANDISALPAELMRKGRFDEIFYVDFPNEKERTSIFEVHLRRRGKLTTDIDCYKLAAATDGFSGADIESVIKDTIEKAFVDGKVALSNDRVMEMVRSTQPLSKVMPDKVKEYQEKFRQTKIKSAS